MVEEIKEEPKEEPNALEVVERLEKANAEAKALMEKQAEIRAKELISGQASAGENQTKKREYTPKEYADAALKGIILQ